MIPFPSIPIHSHPFPSIPIHSHPFPSIPIHSHPFPSIPIHSLRLAPKRFRGPNFSLFGPHIWPYLAPGSSGFRDPGSSQKYAAQPDGFCRDAPAVLEGSDLSGSGGCWWWEAATGNLWDIYLWVISSYICGLPGNPFLITQSTQHNA